MTQRLSSKWKQAAFRKVASRDGSKCCDCGCGQSFTYLCAGGNETEEGYPFSWTYRRSFLELDHIIPLHVGGGNELENLQLMCPPCHLRKTTAERSRRMRNYYAELRTA